jgi:signal peptide peptidase SppA
MSKQALQKCAAQHFGPWAVHPQWFAQAVAAVKAGTFKPEHTAADAASPDDPTVVGDWSGDTFKVRYYIEPGGIARIPFSGQVVKGQSSFGGASSVWTRASVRKAVNDPRVNAILLHIDSPGGTVAGTGDLADDVADADANAPDRKDGDRSGKPVYTYFEDLGASAAYWIGSQARRVFANPTAEVGSIGTMTYVEDTSKMYEKAGVKVTLIATGKHKGQWIDGNPVSDEYIAAVRTEIEDLNAHFLQAVMDGRGMTEEQLAEIADGRVFIADKAKSLGLIDEVSSLDAAVAAIAKEIGNMPITAEQFSAHAAANPQAAEVQALVKQGFEQGYDKAKAELTPKPASLQQLKAAFPGQDSFVLAQLEAGATLEQANAAALAAGATTLKAKDDTIATLQAENAELKKKVSNASAGTTPIPSDQTTTPTGQMSDARRKELLGQTTLGRSVMAGSKN